MRYWHIDSADKIALMLIDRSYYDYDFEAVKEKPKVVTHEQSAARTESMMKRFGFGKYAEGGKPKDAETLQAEVLKDKAER